jgi:pimeloyl-ACP methyl ester carboxylesterase
MSAAALARDDTGDAKLDFQQLCIKYGFQFEQHTVVTDDGYILTQYRIPGLIGDTNTDKPPVLFQHGLLDSANCWIMNYDDVAPAFVAARAGYDVWLGNSRGNTYSLAHVEYDPWKNEKKFWDFDWADMGMYDIPATLDYITSKTNYEKVAYVGHSQGTTQVFYGLAENEDYYKDKMSVFVALAPVTMLPNTDCTLFHLASDLYDEIDDLFDTLNIHSVLNNTWYTSTTVKLFCNAIPPICLALESIFVTNNTEYDDADRFQVYMNHEPNGSSTKAILHYTQNLKEARFQEWAPDYHTFLDIGNKRKTDLIPLNTISQVPIAMFVGNVDELADPTDAEWARQEIGSPVVHYQEINGGHLTFVIGKDMSWFSNDVMPILEKYSPLPNKVAANDTNYLQ